MDTANIVDVVGDFVTLRRRGVNYTACCPFHEEKTPSFSVSPAKGIFKCFGCGKAGNSATFVMEHEHLTYVEALRFLAKKYGIEIVEKEQTPEELIRKNDRESMMIVSAFAQQYFSDILHNTNEGKAVGLSYFKERGFSKAVVDKFQLGYALENRTALAGAAHAAGYKAEFLIKTGLCFERSEDQSLVDRFAGRVMFPIHSLSGRVIGFGGRTLRTDKKVAKYVNSPESEIYLKRNNLYGIFFAKQAISKLDKCYLVEGYTDVISMYQSGVENVVASSGTSLTTEQIKLIARFTEHVTVLFDGDAAGIKASLRGIDMLLEQGMKIKVALLPDGEDPDSFARKHNAEELREFLDAQEQDFLTFKVKLLLGDTPNNDPMKKSEVIRDIVQSIAVIPDSIMRSVYIKECSRSLDIEEDILRTEVGKLRKEKLTATEVTRKAEERHNPSSQYAALHPHDALPPPDFLLPPSEEMPVVPAFINNIFCQEQERELLMFMLKYGRKQLFKVEEDGEERIIHVDEYIISDIKNDELDFQNLHYKQMFEEYDHLLATRSTLEPIKSFLNHEDPKICTEAINLMEDRYVLSKLWGGSESFHVDLAIAVPKAIAVYKLKIVTIAANQLTEQLRSANNQEEQQELLENLMRLNEHRMFFSNFLKRVIV